MEAKSDHYVLFPEFSIWFWSQLPGWTGRQWSLIHFLFLCPNRKMEIKLDNNSHVMSMDALGDPTLSSTVWLSGLQVRGVQGRGVGNLDKADFRSLFFLDWEDQSNHWTRCAFTHTEVRDLWKWGDEFYWRHGMSPKVSTANLWIWTYQQED